MVTKQELEDSLEYLRSVVKGKTFDEVPEAFKDIESTKVKINALEKK